LKHQQPLRRRATLLLLWYLDASAQIILFLEILNFLETLFFSKKICFVKENEISFEISEEYFIFKMKYSKLIEFSKHVPTLALY
jgi:hypothetical protein